MTLAISRPLLPYILISFDRPACESLRILQNRVALPPGVITRGSESFTTPTQPRAPGGGHGHGVTARAGAGRETVLSRCQRDTALRPLSIVSSAFRTTLLPLYNSWRRGISVFSIFKDSETDLQYQPPLVTSFVSPFPSHTRLQRSFWDLEHVPRGSSQHLRTGSAKYRACRHRPVRGEVTHTGKATRTQVSQFLFF